MITATLTTKGQITIPKSVREALRLNTGDRVAFIVHGENEAILRPLTRSVDEVFGMLGKPDIAARTVDDMNHAVATRMADYRV